MTISGSAFLGATSVSFNGTSTTALSAVTATSLRAVVPPGTTTGPIVVTTPAGSSAPSATTFVVTFTAGSIVPAVARVGETVVINGSGLVGTTAVRFNGIAATSFTINAAGTQINAVVPAGAGAPVTVTKSTLTITAAGSFALATPEITGLTPASGAVGSTVVLAGVWFTGASVTFGGLAAEETVDSDTQITAIVPGGLPAGPTTITVTTPTGTDSAPFTVEELVEHIDFNVESTEMPLLGEAWFRQAVAHALDRDAIVTELNALQPLYASQHSLLHLSNEAAYQPSFDDYAYSSATVADIMGDHGCVMGVDDVWSCDGVRASIKFATTSGVARRVAVQTMMQATALAAGIELVPDNATSSVLFGTRLPAQDYEMIMFSWLVNGDSSQAAARYGCDAALNDMGYCSTEVTEFLNDAATEPNPAARSALYNQADVILAQDVPSIPLYRFRNP